MSTYHDGDKWSKKLSSLSMFSRVLPKGLLPSLKVDLQDHSPSLGFHELIHKLACEQNSPKTPNGRLLDLTGWELHKHPQSQQSKTKSNCLHSPAASHPHSESTPVPGPPSPTAALLNQLPIWAQEPEPGPPGRPHDSLIILLGSALVLCVFRW